MEDQKAVENKSELSLAAAAPAPASAPAPAPSNVIDLAAFDTVTRANEGLELELVSPRDGSPLGIFVRVLGRDSDEFRAMQFKQQTRKMNSIAKRGGKISYDAEEMDEEGITLLAACVKSWSVGQNPWTGTIRFNGEDIPCTKDNVLKVFKAVPPFREQVDQFIGDRANFLKG